MIRKLYRAPDPELDAQLDLIFKHDHDDRYARLGHLHDERYDLIPETGYNENGYWWKYADGTQKCWGTKNLGSVAITTTHGSIYLSECQSIIWPIEFTEIHYADIKHLSNSTSMTEMIGVENAGVSVTGQDFYLWGGMSGTFDNVVIGFYVIGRWWYDENSQT